MSLFGIGQQKPHHYREMIRIAWENRDQLPFAWRILNDGVCDGCALGTSGLSDWTLPGVHLCMVRLELMRLNTAPACDTAMLSDVSALRKHADEVARQSDHLAPGRRRRLYAETEEAQPCFDQHRVADPERELHDQRRGAIRQMHCGMIRRHSRPGSAPPRRTPFPAGKAHWRASTARRRAHR